MRQLAIIFVLIALLAPAVLSQQQSGSIVDQTVERFIYLDQRLTQERWEEATGRSDSLQFYLGLRRFLLGDPKLLDALPESDQTAAVSESQRKVQLLRQMAVTQRLETAARVTFVRDSVVDFFERTLVEFEGERYTLSELRQICRTEANRERRTAACGLVMSSASQISDLFERLIRMRDNEVKSFGYNNTIGLLADASALKRDSLATLMTLLREATNNAAREAMENLARQVGSNQATLWDIDHDGQAVYTQVEAYFSVDSQISIVDRTFRGIGIDLDALPIYFDYDSYDGTDISATVYVFDSDYDIRVLAKLSPGFHSMRSLLRAAAEALYISQITQDNRLFARAIPRHWRLTMVNLFDQLTMNVDWLTNIAGVPGNIANSLAAAQRDRELLSMRRLMAEIDFEYQAYQNPQRDLTDLYWSTLTAYLPVAKQNDLPAWAVEPDYLYRPLTHQDHLIARLLSAQIGAYLQKNYGGLVNNRAARSYLVQNYFRFGSRYPWQDLLLRGTDNALTPEAYLTLLGQ